MDLPKLKPEAGGLFYCDEFIVLTIDCGMVRVLGC